MRTSQLQKCRLNLRFLAPAGADTAPLSQPAECWLHHPAACLMLLDCRDGFWQWFITVTAVANVLLIIDLADRSVDIHGIVPFVQVQMLLVARTRNHNRKGVVIN